MMPDCFRQGALSCVWVRWIWPMQTCPTRLWPNSPQQDSAWSLPEHPAWGRRASDAPNATFHPSQAPAELGEEI